MANSTKTVLVLGSTGGCGLSALQYSLAAGYQCVALCRDPERLTTKLGVSQAPSNLRIVQGNAHDSATLIECLRVPGAATMGNNSKLVDTVYFTIGGAFIASKMTIDDPTVCQRGIEALLTALHTLAGTDPRTAKLDPATNPHLIVQSTTGISKVGRDVPLAMVPMYNVMLAVPHVDKKILEDRTAGSGLHYALVRPSWLVDGGKPERKVRVGIEDLDRNVAESKAVGYAISREDVGRWVYENLIDGAKPEYWGKALTITW